MRQVAYAAAAIHFFRERVPYEEKLLLDFFHEDYEAYQRQVPIGIPFVYGWRVTDYQRSWWQSQQRGARRQVLDTP
jgi:hypothetical protein